MKVILHEIFADWESSDMPIVVSPLVAPQGAGKQRFEDFQKNHGDVEHRAKF